MSATVWDSQTMQDADSGMTGGVRRHSRCFPDSGVVGLVSPNRPTREDSCTYIWTAVSSYPVIGF